MLESLTSKQKIIFFIILLIMVIFIIYYLYSSLYQNTMIFSYPDNNLINNNLIQNNENSIFPSEELLENSIIIYICGAVQENKVVKLKENSRICDAIEAVGGLTKDADLTNINLAYILEDGEKIYIPKKGENIENTNISISNSNNDLYYNSSLQKNNKININKATQTELETIPGIGPSTALKIINYREENGKFKNIEDIRNVAGIGETKYEKIKNYISIK